MRKNDKNLFWGTCHRQPYLDRYGPDCKECMEIMLTARIKKADGPRNPHPHLPVAKKRERIRDSHMQLISRISSPTRCGTQPDMPSNTINSVQIHHHIRQDRPTAFLSGYHPAPIRSLRHSLCFQHVSSRHSQSVSASSLLFENRKLWTDD